MALFLSSHMRKSKEESISNNTRDSDCFTKTATNMLTKEEESRTTTNQDGLLQIAPPPIYQDQSLGVTPTLGGVSPMAPPAYYQGQPGTVIYPPVQYPQPQYQYVTQPPMYGQPTVVQYPAGQSSVLIAGQPGPPDHFLMALMVTLFCFCPTGFVAVMRASDARSAVARGDIESAARYSREAKKYINISIVIGIICFILCMVFMVLYISRMMYAVSTMK